MKSICQLLQQLIVFKMNVFSYLIKTTKVKVTYVLQVGDVVLEERPVAWGPKQVIN